jgi:hypothetical protein
MKRWSEESEERSVDDELDVVLLQSYFRPRIVLTEDAPRKGFCVLHGLLIMHPEDVGHVLSCFMLRKPIMPPTFATFLTDPEDHVFKD